MWFLVYVLSGNLKLRSKLDLIIGPFDAEVHATKYRDQCIELGCKGEFWIQRSTHPDDINPTEIS